MIFLLKRSLTILKTCFLRLIPYFPFSKPKTEFGENSVFTYLKQIQFFILAQNICKNVFS